jgi:Fe-S cluster biogenesis protein NfuA
MLPKKKLSATRLINECSAQSGWAVRVLPLTAENVEKVLDEVRPSLMADGGNVALHEIDGLVVVLKLQGACGSCPSSTMTLKMGIETPLRDKIPDILEVDQILDTETVLQLNTDNVDKVARSTLPDLSHCSHKPAKPCSSLIRERAQQDRAVCCNFSGLLDAVGTG